MLHKKTALFELLRAQRAAIKHGLAMSDHMLFEQIVVAKFFSTFVNWASHGSWPGMSFRVKSKTKTSKQMKINKLSHDHQESELTLKHLGSLCYTEHIGRVCWRGGISRGPSESSIE
jgi:hypothetical protein